MKLLIGFVVDINPPDEIMLVHYDGDHVVTSWSVVDGAVGLDELITAANDHSCPTEPSYSTLTPDPVPHH